jgi:hypothetical protein
MRCVVDSEEEQVSSLKPPMRPHQPYIHFRMTISVLLRVCFRSSEGEEDVPVKSAGGYESMKSVSAGNDTSDKNLNVVSAKLW